MSPNTCYTCPQSIKPKRWNKGWVKELTALSLDVTKKTESFR